MSRDAELVPLILNTIDEMRAEHHACTMRHVARRLKLTETWTRNTLHKMEREGMVRYTAMPGSLRTVRSAGAEPIVTSATPATITPKIHKTEDGHMTLDWPDDCGETTAVSHPVLAAMIDAYNASLDTIAERNDELAAARSAHETYQAGVIAGDLNPDGSVSNVAKARMAAETRASRPPTEKELAHRAKLAEAGRARSAAMAGTTLAPRKKAQQQRPRKAGAGKQ